MTDAIAITGLLCNYKPHTKDGGGVISFQLTDPEWQQFLAAAPELWSKWANVRMNDEQTSDISGGS